MSRADMAALRQDEQRAAAAVVGVSDVRFLGHPDGMVEATLELRRDISRVIRQVRPERVLTQSPERNWDFIYASHPDHLADRRGRGVRRLPRRAQPVRPPRAARRRGPRALERAGAVDHGSRRAGGRRRGRHDGHGGAQGGRAHVPQEPDAGPRRRRPSGSSPGPGRQARRPGWPRAAAPSSSGSPASPEATWARAIPGWWCSTWRSRARVRRPSPSPTRAPT